MLCVSGLLSRGPSGHASGSGAALEATPNGRPAPSPAQGQAADPGRLVPVVLSLLAQGTARGIFHAKYD